LKNTIAEHTNGAILITGASSGIGEAAASIDLLAQPATIGRIKSADE
jgi:NADP-dependent 3-hydroxy acid dehydrogenase YdfG